ncbi:MAG TPA: Trm112 family protein, partial [Pseudomonadales bacterium]|nr:Trm112 family protein [Pseudomonadales bacterium]
CKGKLDLKSDADELWCRADGLAYPIKDNIPVMLDTEARQLTTDEKLDS